MLDTFTYTSTAYCIALFNVSNLTEYERVRKVYKMLGNFSQCTFSFLCWAGHLGPGKDNDVGQR